MHTCIQLKNRLVWSTLKAVPILHHELMSRHNLHLVYLGFGIFLHLKPWSPIDVNVLPTLGEITSDQPKVLEQLMVTGIKQEKCIPLTGMTPKARQATAAAGSAAQLAHVEAELKQEPQPHANKTCQGNKPKPSTSTWGDGSGLLATTAWHKPQVTQRPFAFRLIKLTQCDIEQYIGKSKKKPVLPHLKECSIKVRRLPLTPNQSVTVAQPKQK